MKRTPSISGQLPRQKEQIRPTPTANEPTSNSLRGILMTGATGNGTKIGFVKDGEGRLSGRHEYLRHSTHRTRGWRENIGEFIKKRLPEQGIKKKGEKGGEKLFTPQSPEPRPREGGRPATYVGNTQTKKKEGAKQTDMSC